jgi:hypothetical protein
MLYDFNNYVLSITENFIEYVFLNFLFVSCLDFEKDKIYVNVDNYELFLYNFDIKEIKFFFMKNNSNLNNGYIGQVVRIFVTRCTNLKNNTIVSLRDAHTTTQNLGDVITLKKFKKSNKKYLI